MVVVKKELIKKRPILVGLAKRSTSAKRLPISQPIIRTRGSIMKEDHLIK
jgi:hypothetical protein